MLRLLKWAVVLAALGAVVALVPVGGRTLLARWQAARSPSQFAAGAWDEIEKAVGRLADGWAEPRAGSRGQARAPARPPAATPSRPPPIERHTKADRSAVDSIVAEHAH
jgi:hypothetical protein